MTASLRTTSVTALLAVLLPLAACTSKGADPTTAAPSTTLTTSPPPSPTSTSATPTPSPSPSPSTSSAAPVAETVQDVSWDDERLPVLCGGRAELVQLSGGTGKTKDGLTVGFLDVTFGSVSGDPVENIAVVQLECVGAHPGPVDAPVFRSGAQGPEFLGFATMSLDRFGSAEVSAEGIVVRGTGFSDTAPGCCPDLDATMTSAVVRDAVVLQERDTEPIKGAKPGDECDIFPQIDAQADDLRAQAKGKEPTSAAAVGAAVPLSKLTAPAVAARALFFLGRVGDIARRGCP